MPVVRHLQDDLGIEAGWGETLLEAALRAGIPRAAAARASRQVAAAHLYAVGGLR